mmetsp:Transcript_36041/g.55367  ORF Transcript_36041/g.55367 Transcript_36041/m.55367 type:complete len:181 (+) Transcript_36041:148-690(+)|eukprot:CAMPEP_0118694706 /NCGR_PEP_ID=MMETSP0800-20121206/12714_1 /TAXON_ID=210618 ORGANISM="Striatella unipunctata, Strain CCMP2910" /NCGR_SAMPLE_ID=MMETSP0800 /ASSEMBLY_ACC=CAM_ASM_000638 /LENGTH=180 /DNA_ID=CAMNT_0006593285 /DNA_START=87 /DNA_END=629 /DNA_ORIENTATION=+
MMHFVCDPMKQAWQSTNSIWGKFCIILFYSFVWMQILGAVWSQFAPTTGWECLWATVQESDMRLLIATIKSCNIWILGFFLLSNRGGIEVWNVFMVWIHYLLQWLVYKPAIEDFLAEACPQELEQLESAMVVSEIWVTAILICSILNNKYVIGCFNGGRGENATGQASPLLEEVGGGGNP